MSPTSTWKSVERRVAKALGGVRMGPGGDRADVRTTWLCVEVKQRKVLPDWLTKALAQARKYARPEQLPIAVLHEAGAHDSLVVMSLKDFQEWFGSKEESGE